MAPLPQTGQITLSTPSVRVTIVGALVNVALVVIKLFLGFTGHSKALVADGIHSMTDLVSDAIVLGGLMIGSLPRDETHHYGHAKVELLAEMFLGLLLVVAGVYISFDSISALFIHDLAAPSVIVIPAALVSVISKEWLFRISIRVGKREERPSVIANAWHHRSDALSSLGVLIGVTLAVLHPSLMAADALMGFIVALVVIKAGWEIGWNAVIRVIDTSPGKEYESRIARLIGEVPGVLSIRDLRLRYVGNRIAVELHLGLDPDMSVRMGHDIATAVKRHVMAKDRRVFDVLVHMEPEESTRSVDSGDR